MLVQAVDKFVDLRGLAFHYRDWGASGRPLVLLHGLASSSHIWNLSAPVLAERFTVLALDQRGHGESARPDDGYDFDSVSGDLDAFITALDLEAPVLVGHSWGGSVVVHYAASHPDKVAGIVLVDGGFTEMSSREEMTWERVERDLSPPDFIGVTVDAFKERARGWALGGLWRPEIEKAVLANFEVLDDGTIRARLSRDRHMKILRSLWEVKSSALYGRIECPVFLVPAVQDPVDERMARRMQGKKEGV